jgi:hypothetical protein
MACGSSKKMTKSAKRAKKMPAKQAKKMPMKKGM